MEHLIKKTAAIYTKIELIASYSNKQQKISEIRISIRENFSIRFRLLPESY